MRAGKDELLHFTLFIIKQILFLFQCLLLGFEHCLLIYPSCNW